MMGDKQKLPVQPWGANQGGSQGFGGYGSGFNDFMNNPAIKPLTDYVGGIANQMKQTFEPITNAIKQAQKPQASLPTPVGGTPISNPQTPPAATNATDGATQFNPNQFMQQLMDLLHLQNPGYKFNPVDHNPFDGTSGSRGGSLY